MHNIKLKNVHFEHSGDRGRVDLSYQFVEPDYEEETEEVVGSATIVIYDEAWGDVRDCADQQSQEEYDVVSSVTFDADEAGEKPYIFGRLAVITGFTIEPDKRGNGYGTSSMHEVLNFLKSVMTVDFVLLHACPYITDLPHTHENLSEVEKIENSIFVTETKQKLSHFYESIGFEPIETSMKNHMLLDLDDYFGEMDDEYNDELEDDLEFEEDIEVGDCQHPPLKEAEFPTNRKEIESMLINYFNNPGIKAEHRESVLAHADADNIAKAITHFAFRTGPVEDMHADPNSQLSDDDMKTLNKFMVNRLAYVFQLILDEKWIEFDFLVKEWLIMGASDWDPAIIDDDGMSERFMNDQIDRIRGVAKLGLQMVS